MGLHLEVILYRPWTQNSIKLKLLYEFLNKADPEQLLLVVDALDVALFDSKTTIIDKFNYFNVDILISAEANFMFKNPILGLKYLVAYPPQPTVYNFVNSGSYIGTPKHLKVMLESIQSDYGIDLADEEAVLSLRSDQYLLHRFFVDNYHKQGEKLKVALDSQQLLLGCTGGRTCIRKFRNHSKTQAFLHFQIERNLVKLFQLHRYQSQFKDYEIRSGRFYNLKTQTTPSVMHLPGTYGNFEVMYNRFFSTSRYEYANPTKKIIADAVSYFSYASSLLLSVIVRGFKLFARSLKKKPLLGDA